MSPQDQQKLERVYSKSKLNAVVLAEMAQMERARETTDIHRFRRRLLQLGYEPSVEDVLEVFIDMEKAGFGRVVLGQNGGEIPHRFVWGKYNIKLVGKEALKEGVVETTQAPRPGSIVPTSGQGKTVVVYRSSTGENIKLLFNSPHEVKDLISLLQGLL